MLIIYIALGIVLGVILLAFLEQIITVALGGIVIAVAIGLIILAIWFVTSSDLRQALGIGVALLVVGLVFYADFDAQSKADVANTVSGGSREHDTQYFIQKKGPLGWGDNSSAFLSLAYPQQFIAGKDPKKWRIVERCGAREVVVSFDKVEA